MRPERASRPDRPARPEKASPPTRRRRDATEARAAILDAAERRLVEAGPAGIRLQEVAADVGVSHPTVLHHFGSREALVKAVIQRSFAALHAELVDAIQRSSGGEAQLAAMLEAVFQTLSARGHGRVLMWLALEGQRVGGADVSLSAVVDAAVALRRRKCEAEGGLARGAAEGAERRPDISREDTAHVVVLAALALTSFAVLGPAMLDEAGLPHGEAAGARFRAWLARVLLAHLESNGAAPAAR